MTTTHPSPGTAAELPRESGAGTGAEIASEGALVPSPQSPESQGALALTPQVARLPVELDVAIPVREFRVRNLLALEPGQVIETLWAHGEDMPLSAGNAQLAWSEFEVVDSRLAVRVTRLA